MIEHFIFRLNLTGNYTVKATDMPLDRHAPSGFFQGKNNRRYLVCDDPVRRFAVVLSHDEMEPFAVFALGDLSTDVGWVLPVTSVHLGDDCIEGPEDEELGMIEIDGPALKLYVSTMEGHRYWQTIASGECFGRRFQFRDWTIWDEATPLFEIDRRGEANR